MHRPMMPPVGRAPVPSTGPRPRAVPVPGHESPKPIFLRDGAARSCSSARPSASIWKAAAATTGGGFDRFELTADPDHEGAPEHVRDAVDESVCVRDGAFEFKLGDERLIADAGTLGFVPRGTNHMWRNAVLRRSRKILTYVPGGMKAFFQQASSLMHAAAPDR